ncbi:hypothetical protein M9458_047338, partial [Cirrhinus mrigala]
VMSAVITGAAPFQTERPSRQLLRPPRPLKYQLNPWQPRQHPRAHRTHLQVVS